MKQRFYLACIASTNIALIFGFQWFILVQWGAGKETDVFFTSITLPQIIIGLMSGSLMHVLVPLFTNRTKKQQASDAWLLSYWLIGVFCLLGLGLGCSAAYWMPILLPGFSEAQQQSCMLLFQIQMISMVFAVIHGVQWALCHARQQFVWAEVVPLFTHVAALIGLVYALPLYGIVAAAWIMAARAGLQALWLLPILGKPTLATDNNSIRLAWQRLKPLLIGAAYYKTEPLLDRFLLSMASQGQLSLFYMAQQLYAASTHIINKAVVAPLVPRLSHYYQRNQRQAFFKLYDQHIKMISGFCLLALLCIMPLLYLLLPSLSNLVHLSLADIHRLWFFLLCLSGMFLGAAIGQLCAAGFYAMGNTRTPTMMSMCSYTVFIPCKVFAFYDGGITALAITSSLYYLLNAVLQIYLLRRCYVPYST